jgi:hypothetical protein
MLSGFKFVPDVGALFQLEIVFDLFARVEGADGLDRTLFGAVLGPDFVIIDHAYLSEAESTVGGAGETLHVAGLQVLEKHGDAAGRGVVLVDFANDCALAEVLRLSNLWSNHAALAGAADGEDTDHCGCKQNREYKHCLAMPCAAVRCLILR